MIVTPMSRIALQNTKGIFHKHRISKLVWIYIHAK